MNARRLFTVVSFALACLVAARAEANERPKAGDKAPAFSLPASDGKTIKLADYARRKTVVLAFFPKAFTGG